MPCTTILVGKKASYDGSTIIARNEDSKTEEERAFNEAADSETTYGDYLRYNRKFINRR